MRISPQINNNVAFKGYLRFSHDGVYAPEDKKFREECPATYIPNSKLQEGLENIINGLDANSNFNLSIWSVKGKKSRVTDNAPDASFVFNNGNAYWYYPQKKFFGLFSGDDIIGSRFFKLKHGHTIGESDKNFARAIANGLVTGLKNDNKEIVSVEEKKQAVNPAVIKRYEFGREQKVPFDVYAALNTFSEPDDDPIE